MRKQILKSLVLGALAVSAALVTGCFTSNDSGSKDATLSISMGLPNVNKGGALSKGATISYNKLIVTMISNATVKDTIRDTIVPGQNGFTAVATDSQMVTKTYSIKPLRSWTVSVKTLDQKDSVIHNATTTASNVLIGETRNVTLILTSKFVMYVAKFILPDSLSYTDGTLKQVLNVNRFVMKVDGRTVVDSSKAVGYFAATPTVHSIQFDYIKADTAHSLELYIYGVIPGWPTNKPLFGDTIPVTAPVPGRPDTTYRPTLPWMGPGSPDDTSSHGGSNNGSKLGLTVVIGKVGLVSIEPIINGTLGKGKK